MFKSPWLKDVTRFDKKDRIGAIVIVTVVGSSLLLPRLLAPSHQLLTLKNDSTLLLAMDTLQKIETKKSFSKKEEYNHAYQYEPSLRKSFTKGDLFPFDPNTTSFQDWQRLGLNERTSKTILNYVSKGGKFYKPEDLKKIWGLPEGFYEQVKSYIVITSVQKNNYQKSFASYGENKQKFEKPERKFASINVNEADTSALIALPGIGSKLSARIISFREKLGGFYSVDQIGETYGLPDSTFQKIKSRLKADGTDVRKINLNAATKEELKAHPYIRWNLANAIVEYRNQHGAFKSLEELKKIVLIDESTFNRISHYLSL